MRNQSRSPLGRRFWTVWAAATTSNVGDGVVLAALPLLAAELTREPLGVATTTAAVRLPWLVFGLFAGVVVDRVDRLRLMIVTDILRGAAFVVLVLLMAGDDLGLVVLYLTVFGIGALETLFDTAAMSMTPALVQPDQLDRANARINGAQIAANEFAGPPLGGLLFAVAVSLPFGVNAVTFATSAAILLTVGGSYRAERLTRTTVLEDIRAGFAFVWKRPVVRGFAIGAGVINLGSTAALAVLVLHAQDNLGLGSFGFGALLGGGAVGGIVGAQLAPGLIERTGRRRAVMASVVAMSIAVAVMGVATSGWVAGAGFAVFGFAGEIWNVVSVTYRQRVTPDAYLGRVMSGFRVIAYGAFPIGATIGGVLASVTNVRAPFYCGAVLILGLVPFLGIATRHDDLDGTGRTQR